MRTIPEWQRQAVVRAIVFGELTLAEIAAEVGISLRTVKSIKANLLTLAPQNQPMRAHG